MILAAKTSAVTQRDEPRQAELQNDTKQKRAQEKACANPMHFRLSVRQFSIAGVIFAAVSLLLWPKGFQHGLGLSMKSGAVDWNVRREEVKEAFVTSWDAYAKYAWAEDLFHPLRKEGSSMSPKDLGWIIIDSLDTMMIMNLTSQLADVRLWISRKLTWEQDQDVNTFETTIRVVASRRDYIYLEKSIDLADRLLGAYDSPSGVPYASVDLRTTAGIPSHDGRVSSVAEAGTVQLEMNYLAHLTGKEIYWRKVRKVMQVLDDNAMEDGLLPIYVSTETGRFTSKEIRLGSRGDSYYEYLIKQFIQTGESIYLDMWEEALFGIQKHMITTTKHANLQFVAELPSGIGGRLSPKMGHLVAFLPGAIALGVTSGLTVVEAQKLPTWSTKKDQQIELAKELTKTFWGMYDVTDSGLAPEIAWFAADDADLQPRPGERKMPSSSIKRDMWKKDCIIKRPDAHNLQRPETVESLFVMFRITENPIYREWGWKIFQSFQKYGLVEDGEGYTSLNDVRSVPPTRRDNMESFWLAETLKYLYLLFSPSDFLPLQQVVFNTEAHILPRLNTTDLKFKTGWSRKCTPGRGG